MASVHAGHEVLQTINKNDYRDEAHDAVDKFNELVRTHYEDDEKCDIGEAQDVEKARAFFEKMKDLDTEAMAEFDIKSLQDTASGITTATELSVKLLSLLPQ